MVRNRLPAQLLKIEAKFSANSLDDVKKTLKLVMSRALMKIVPLLMTLIAECSLREFSHLWLCTISSVWTALLRSITETRG